MPERFLFSIAKFKKKDKKKNDFLLQKVKQKLSEPTGLKEKESLWLFDGFKHEIV